MRCKPSIAFQSQASVLSTSSQSEASKVTSHRLSAGSLLAWWCETCLPASASAMHGTSLCPCQVIRFVRMRCHMSWPHFSAHLCFNIGNSLSVIAMELALIISARMLKVRQFAHVPACMPKGVLSQPLRSEVHGRACDLISSTRGGPVIPDLKEIFCNPKGHFGFSYVLEGSMPLRSVLEIRSGSSRCVCMVYVNSTYMIS